MRRFSLLVVVLVASGCFSSSAGKSGPTPPPSEATRVGEANLDITLRQYTAIRRSDWRFHVSCPHIEGGIKPSHLCQGITAPGSTFFGVPTSVATLWGAGGTLRIRGTVNG